MLALFFAVIVCFAWLLFCKQITHIYISCFSAGCCRYNLLDLSNFLYAHFRSYCLHSRFMFFTLLLAPCFALLQLFLMFVWLVSCLLFLLSKLAGLNKFALARFRFFWRCCSFFLPLLTHIDLYRTARLFLPLYSSTWSPLVHYGNPCRLTEFSRCVYTSKNMSWTTIYGSFGLVFASSLVHAFIHTHPHPSTPIYTHYWHFSSNPPKHDVRGNFPGHRAQILVCETLNDPCLPCFCVPCTPCTLTHPSTPIHTHLHLFSPVRTLNFMYICII